MPHASLKPWKPWQKQVWFAYVKILLVVVPLVILGNCAQSIYQGRNLQQTKACPQCNLFLSQQWRANLSGANLQEAGITYANWSGSQLQRANLREADLSNSRFRGVDLSGANLQEADLTFTNLREANLSGADLSGAKLAYTDLRNANLTGANLSGAALTATDLRGAVLTDANLTEARLRNTKLPDGTVKTGEFSFGDSP
jgi:uncharacterized protein YjbI with pentapeptide repeats